VPSQEKLDSLKPKVNGTIALCGEPLFSAFVAHDNIDWEKAGFQKVASLAPRPGDEKADAASGVAWTAIAGRLRGEARWLR
jgi:hypothetical protein